LEFEPRIQGESSLQLLAGGLHAQAAVAFRHLVQRAGQRNEQGTAEQQEQKGGKGWSKPRGTAGVVVELGALVADLFHWFGGRRPPKGPGRSGVALQALTDLLSCGVMKNRFVRAAAQDEARVAELCGGGAAINEKKTGFDCLELKGHGGVVA